jgi:hypothetical protein
MLINVLEHCSPMVSREDGEKLRNKIDTAWLLGVMPVLDFGNHRVASIGFLDEGIAVLAKAGDNPLDKIEIVNMAGADLDLLKFLVSIRLKGWRN